MPAPDATDPRGPLLWEYRPPRAHPILYAGLLVFALVFVTGSLENLARANRPVIYAVYAAPLLLTAATMALLWPSTVRIHQHGIAPARPRLLRWHRPFLPWADAAAVYPSYYDVTGAFVSPFASSDGKVTQMGLRLEMRDGHAETIRFTPTRFVMGQDRSAGFEGAIDTVRRVFADMGRPLTAVADAESFGREEAEALLAEATRPFLPFLLIVALFAGAAPLLALLLWLDVPVWAALPVALALPVGTSLQSYLRSRRRTAILDRLAKAAEAKR